MRLALEVVQAQRPVEVVVQAQHPGEVVERLAVLVLLLVAA